MDGGAPSGLGGHGYRTYVVAAPMISTRDSQGTLTNNTASRRETFRKNRRLRRVRSR